MASADSFNDICPRCGYGGCYSFVNCHTMERCFYCNSCGAFESKWLKWDGNGHVVKQNMYYRIDGSLIMGVRAYRPEKSWYTDEVPYDQLPEAGAILWEKSIFSDTTYEEIIDFLYTQYNSQTVCSYPKINKYNPELKNTQTFKFSYPSLFIKSNEGYKKIWRPNEPFRLDVNTDGQVDLAITKDVMDVTHGGGYGMIHMLSKSDQYTPSREICCKRFDNPVSIEDALSLWDANMPDDLDINLSYLSVWDSSGETVICLKGRIPDDMCDGAEGDFDE